MPISRGFHWSVLKTLQDRAQKERDLPYRGAFFSTVLGPAEGEQVVVESLVGRKTISYAYPFASTNAWIRGQPESNVTMLSIIGGDSRDLQPISYYDKSKSAAASTYQEVTQAIRRSPNSIPTRILPYRALNPGELDVASNFAQAFFGLGDVAQFRGGLSHFVLSSLKTVIETPQLEVHGPAHAVSGTLNDEIRFGTVRRFVPGLGTSASSATAPSLVRGPILQTNPITASIPFAKEWSVILGWTGLTPVLLDHRQGIVTEDDGSFGKATKTGKDLRARLRWKTLLSETKAEIDDAGNWYLSTALDGVEGGAVDIPFGNFALDVGQRTTIRSRLDTEMSAGLFGRVNISAGAGFTVTTPFLGEINADTGLDIKSIGGINIKSPIPAGIRLGGGPAGVPYPVLIANPTYLSTQTAWLSTAAAFAGTAGAYGAAAATAWAAIGPLTTLLDPTGSVATLCLTAGAAASALSAAALAEQAALTAYMPTLSPAPVGYISTKTISE